MQEVNRKKNEMMFVDGGEDVSAPPDSLKGMDETFTRAPVPTTFLGKVQYYYASTVCEIRRQFSLVRPWKEFFDRQSFGTPSSLGDCMSRLSCNVNYFYHNYLIVGLAGSSYVLLLNPFFSICVFLVGMMWWYVRVKGLEAAATNSNHFTLSHREITFTQAYIFIILFGGISFFLFNGSSVVFWLVVSSVGIAVPHAVLRKPTQDEQPFSFV